jgi:hypothetical protein
MVNTIGSLAIKVYARVVEGCHIAIVSNESPAISYLDVAGITHKAH